MKRRADSIRGHLTGLQNKWVARVRRMALTPRIVAIERKLRAAEDANDREYLLSKDALATVGREPVGGRIGERRRAPARKFSLRRG